MPIEIEDNNSIPQIVNALPFYYEQVYHQMMARAHWWIQEIFRTQGPQNIIDPITRELYTRWLDIAPATVERKKGEKTILIDTGIMRNSIQIIDVMQRDTTLIGRIGIFGGPAMRYAKTHEFGGVIRIKVTEKMRNYFLALFLEEKKTFPGRKKEDMMHFPLRKDTKELTVYIPERSFMRAGLISSTADLMALVIAVLDGVLEGRLK